MLDVLTLTREGRLAVLELKADEDIHPPLQGLEYRSGVQWHHARGEFASAGYFARREISWADPLLFLVAPTLHIHLATDTLLHYVHPAIDWTLVGIDERWREGVRVIFRKRRRIMICAPEWTRGLPKHSRDPINAPAEAYLLPDICHSERSESLP